MSPAIRKRIEALEQSAPPPSAPINLTGLSQADWQFVEDAAQRFAAYGGLGIFTLPELRRLYALTGASVTN